jgi:hypothetical protein
LDWQRCCKQTPTLSIIFLFIALLEQLALNHANILYFVEDFQNTEHKSQSRRADPPVSFSQNQLIVARWRGEESDSKRSTVSFKFTGRLDVFAFGTFELENVMEPFRCCASLQHPLFRNKIFSSLKHHTEESFGIL